jgi:hypothetical protein
MTVWRRMARPGASTVRHEQCSGYRFGRIQWAPRNTIDTSVRPGVAGSERSLFVVWIPTDLRDRQRLSGDRVTRHKPIRFG